MRALRFKKLINKYSQPITVRRDEEGQMVGPRWVPGETTEYEVSAAPFFLTPEDLRHYEGLNYTTQDLKLFAVESLTAKNMATGEKVDFEFHVGDIVAFRSNKYKVDTPQDHTIHADFQTYVARLMPSEANNSA